VEEAKGAKEEGAFKKPTNWVGIRRVRGERIFHT
jgi:hypothetical protein